MIGLSLDFATWSWIGGLKVEDGLSMSLVPLLRILPHKLDNAVL